ncbi:MAG: hypothetical protein ACOVQG_10640, partial [Crocinitomicaceae bacterium]
NNNEALPDGLVGLYDKELFPPTMKWKERRELLHFFLVFALAQKEISADFAAEILGDEWYDHADENSSKEEKRLQRVNELIQLHSKRFSSAGSGRYRLYHERFRVYVLQKVTEKDIAQFNNKFIALCEKALEVKKEKDIPEKESYALEFITTHFFIVAMQGETECLHNEHAAALKKYAYDQQFWERQISSTQRYVLPKLSLENLIRWATKFDDKRIIFETNLKLIELANIEIKRTSQDSLIELVKLDFELAISRIQDLQIDAKSKFKLILSVFQYFQEHDLVCQNAKNVLKLIQLLKNDESLRTITLQSNDIFPFILDWYLNEISLEIIYEDKTKFLHRLENFAEWWMEHHLAKSSDFESLLIHYINNYQDTENICFKLFQYYINTNINRCIEIVSKENEDSTILPQFYFELLEYYLESNFEECKTIFNDKKFKSSKFYSLLRDGWYESSKKRFIVIARIFTEKSFQESGKLDFDLCFELHKKVDAEKQFANICAKYFDTSFAFDLIQINSSKIIQYDESSDFCYLDDINADFFLNFLKAKVNQNVSIRQLRFVFGYYQTQNGIYPNLLKAIEQIEVKFQMRMIPENVLLLFIEYYIWLAEIAIVIRNLGTAVQLLKKSGYYLDELREFSPSLEFHILKFSKQLARNFFTIGIKNRWVNCVENIDKMLMRFNCWENNLNLTTSKNEVTQLPENKITSTKKTKKQRVLDYLVANNYTKYSKFYFEQKKTLQKKNVKIIDEINQLIESENHTDLLLLDFLILEAVKKTDLSYRQVQSVYATFNTQEFRKIFIDYCITEGPLSCDYFEALKLINSFENNKLKILALKEIKAHILPGNLTINVLIEFYKNTKLKKDERVDLLKKFIIYHLIDKANEVEIKIDDDHSINLNSIMGLIWNHDEKTIDQHLFELAKV